LSKQKEYGLYVKVVLKVDDDFVHIEIRNNSVITAFEEERISDKINKAKQFNSLEEVFTSVLDATEGAGLGIIIIILMLQKVGLSKDNYKVYTTENETVTSIVLPVNQQFNSEVTDLLVKFVSIQEKIPVLESNFTKIKSVLSESEVNINDLVECFSKDLFLTIYLLNKVALKHENVFSIVKAIEIIGKENLKNQFFADQDLFLIIQDERDDRKLWEHAYRVGFFASCLMQRVNLKNKLSEDQMFVLGMLHDIGVAALEVLSIENKVLLNQYCDEKNICEYAKELFYNDNKHSVSGSLLVKKWLLPTIISDVIRYHNEPNTCPEELKEIISVIYIADMLQYFGEGQIEFSQIEKTALECLDIETEEELRIIYTEIQKLF
jgi:HD-like signal output (HDOD) protein